MRWKAGPPKDTNWFIPCNILATPFVGCFLRWQQMGSIKTRLTVLPLCPQPSRPILGCLLPTNSTDSSSSIFGVNEMKQATATEITPAPRVSAPTPSAQHRYTCAHLPGPRPLSEAVYAVFLIQRVPTMNPVGKEIRAPSYTHSGKPGFTAIVPAFLLAQKECS